jgi:hypothetical protein
MSKYVSHVRDIPTKECWVIIKDIAIAIPGDERSKQDPGHGYPEHTDHYAQVYEVFDTEEDFVQAMNACAYSEHLAGGLLNPNFRGVKVIPYDVTVTVQAKVTPAKS